MSKKFGRSETESNILGDSNYLSDCCLEENKEADHDHTTEILEGDETPSHLPKLEKNSESAPAYLPSADSFAELCNSQIHGQANTPNQVNTSSSFDDSMPVFVPRLEVRVLEGEEPLREMVVGAATLQS